MNDTMRVYPLAERTPGRYRGAPGWGSEEEVHEARAMRNFYTMHLM